MDRWLQEIAVTRYRFMRVSRATGNETERLTMLKGGTITRNNDVRIMETATVEVVGDFDIGPDFVRIYMDAEWHDGHAESVALGTFIPSVPSRDLNSEYSTSSVDLYGRLQELLDDKFTEPVTLEPGTNAVEYAAQVCRDMGLEVLADESPYTISRARSYGLGATQSNSETDDTKLGMVNDLLSLADFQAAKTDPLGRVLLRRYVAPEDKEPVWSFVEGPDAKFESDMTDERDTMSVANHVVVYYRGDEETCMGEAWDHASEFSVENQGRVVTKTYEYTELPEGETAEERDAYADNRAASLLSTAQSVIRRVKFSHAYAPISITDSAQLTFPSGGIDSKFEIRTMTLHLVGGCRCDTEGRQFQRTRARDRQ